MDAFRVLFDELDWQCPAPGLRVKAWRQGNRQLRLLEQSPEFVEEAWCEKAHCGLVLEGELELVFLERDHQERCVRFPQGAGLLIPAGQQHKGRAVGSRVVIFLVEDI